jgi:predicted RNA-binding Zn-ribbon protein involved in translation (DUF1610 family)
MMQKLMVTGNAPRCVDCGQVTRESTFWKCSLCGRVICLACDFLRGARFKHLCPKTPEGKKWAR